jgi:hypothetical protein
VSTRQFLDFPQDGDIIANFRNRLLRPAPALPRRLVGGVNPVSSQGSPSTRAAFAYTHRTNPLKSQSRGSMELIPAETSLVVAGAWNAAILTPPWVLKHAFHKPPQDQHTVQVFLPAAAGLIFESPRFAFEGVTYSVRPDALVFAPNSSDSDSLFKVETAAANIVGSSCAFDERKELGVWMAVQGARNSCQRGRSAGCENRPQDGSATGSFRQRSGACPHGGATNCAPSSTSSTLATC